VDQKQAMVNESTQPGESISSVARRHNISPSLLFTWRKLAESGSLTAVGAEEEVVPSSQYKEMAQRVRELERLLGKKTLENEILKEAIDIARQKKLLLRSPSLPKDDSL
jgi:transposase